MIGSSLTKHLSDKDRYTQTCKQTQKPVLFYASTNEAEREYIFNSLLPIQIGVKGGKTRKQNNQRNKISVGNYADANSEYCWKRGRCGDIIFKAQRWGLLGASSIRFVSCPLLRPPLSFSPLPPGLNWPPQLHLTPLPACSAHVYASQIPSGHGQIGRPGVAQGSPNKSNLVRHTVRVKYPVCSPSIVLIRPRQQEIEGLEAPKGTFSLGHYPPVGESRMWLLRETDVTAHLVDESIKEDWNFFKGERCKQTYMFSGKLKDKLDTEANVQGKKYIIKWRP